MIRGFMCLVLIAMISLPANPASADRLQRLTKRLEKGSEKGRLSAALSLAKSSDVRAIVALSKALRRDSSALIRRVSAASLGERLLLQRPENLAIRKDAMDTLKRSAKIDRASSVRNASSVAISKIRLSRRQAQVTEARTQTEQKARRSKGLLVGVTSPKSSPKVSLGTTKLLETTVRAVLNDAALRSIRTGQLTTDKLERSGRAGYLVAPIVSKLKLIRDGSYRQVRCEVRVHLSPWAGEGQRWGLTKTATVTGAATVSAGSSKSAISLASKECLAAVLTQVTKTKVLPFLVAVAR